MAKESPKSPYPKLIFRETFNDAATVRKNGGTPTAVTFFNGAGTFDGTTSKINYNLNLNGTYSVRVRCNPTSFAVIRLILDCRSSNADGVGYVRLTTGGLVEATLGAAYVNGVATTTTVAGVNNEIVVTGLSLKQGTGANLSLIGSNYTDSQEFLGTMDLLEIYSGTLTASEVANLYNNRWNKEYMSGGEPMSNRVANGTFSSDTLWTKEAGWTIENGTANCNGTNGARLTQNCGFTLNKNYLVKVTATVTSGSLSLLLGGNGVASLITASGSYEYIKTAGSIATETLYFISTNFVGSIDNVSVQEIAPTLLLDFNSTNGVLEDKTVGNAVTGTDLVSGWNFTSGWTQVLITGISVNSITTTAAGGVYRAVFTAGKRYKIIIAGTSTTTIGLRNSAGFNITTIGDGFGSYEFTASDTNLYLRNAGAGTTTITQLIVQEIKPDLTPTAVSIVKRGTKYSANFNGTTSLINTGADFIWTKAITVCGWINPTSWGGGSLGAIIDNSRTILQKFAISATTGRIRLTSNNSTYATSATDLITNQNQFICVTRSMAGVVNFYIGNSTTAPALSGTANQSSGTPVAGTTNVFIGNNTGATRTFNGLIPMLKVYEGILDLPTITQIWSESLKDIKE